jgi:hypothetical protein
MLRKILYLTAIILVFAASNLQATQIYVSWDGGGDGHSWSDANNWEPNIVPDNNVSNTFIVTIDSNSFSVDEIEVDLQQRRDINSLDCYGSVRLESGMWYLPDLNISSGLTNHGNLALGVDIRGDVTNTAGTELEIWGHLNIYGNLFNQTGATIWFSHIDIDIEDGGIIENDGLIICYAGGGPGEMPLFENRGTIQLVGGSCSAENIFDNTSTGGIRGYGIITGHQLIQNKGIIHASSGGLLLVTEGSITNTGILKNDAGAMLHVINFPGTSPLENVNNHGTIEVNADGSVVFDCNLFNEPNGIIKLFGGTLAANTITQSTDANFAGFGGITGNVVIENNGLIKLNGPTNIIGDVNITDNSTLEISDGTTLVTGQTNCNGTIYMKGGYIIPQEGLSGNCNVIWEPGLYTNVADFNLDGQVNFKDFTYFANSWLWQSSWR